MIKKKPDNWLTMKETEDYIRKEHKRHWSRTNIYNYMDTGKLKFFKVGSSRIVLKEDVDVLVKSFTKPAPHWKPMAEGE